MTLITNLLYVKIKKKFHKEMLKNRFRSESFNSVIHAKKRIALFKKRSFVKYEQSSF